jgi:hypothetical protein
MISEAWQTRPADEALAHRLASFNVPYVNLVIVVAISFSPPGAEPTQRAICVAS